MSYLLEQSGPGFCPLDVIAAVILIAVIAVSVVTAHRHRQEDKALDEELARLLSNSVDDASELVIE